MKLKSGTYQVKKKTSQDRKREAQDADVAGHRAGISALEGFEVEGLKMSGQDPSVKPSHIHVEPSNSAQNDLNSMPESNPLSRCQTISKEIFEQLLPWQQQLIILSGQAHLETRDEELAKGFEFTVMKMAELVGDMERKIENMHKIMESSIAQQSVINNLILMIANVQQQINEVREVLKAKKEDE